MSDDERIQKVRREIAEFPKQPGVYFMKDAEGRVLYVGKAKDLRSRAGSYFQPSAHLLETRGPDIAKMVMLVHEVDFMECDGEVDALLKESRLIKDIQPPFNAQLKDGKTYPYIEITTGDDFPAVFVTRSPRPRGNKLYGPFISGRGVRDAVALLQKIFKFRTCELDIRADDSSRRHFRPCLLHSIHQCSAPCADSIGKEEYKADIDRLKRFLVSKRSVMLRKMKADMERASKELRFEEAAKLRDQIRAIESLALSGNVKTHVQPEAFFIDPAIGLEKLADLLELEDVPRSLECIDIAHLQGDSTVGSVVCFIDGKPFKPGYKRYRIETVEGVDDYAAIREVVARRYRHAAAGEELFPDLVIIDGGLGQLRSALRAVESMDFKPRMVISLAKREEEIYIQGRSAPLRLPRHDEALRLLQYVRDEAHRFAQYYHHLLRSKKVVPSRGGRGLKRRGRPARPSSSQSPPHAGGAD